MKNTRNLFLFLLAISLATPVFSQDSKPKPSPAQTAEATVNEGKISISYSSPAVKGRVIYGELVPFGKVWRTGANEATTLTIEKDMTINGETLKAGKYGFFTIPGKEEWIVILNSVWDQWGAYNYDQKSDVLRFTVTPENLAEPVERMTFAIDQTGVVRYTWSDIGFKFQLK